MNIYELTGQYKLLETAIALNPDEDELKEELAKLSKYLCVQRSFGSADNILRSKFLEERITNDSPIL